MKNCKILFFDIDGTLVDYSCAMPDSTKAALDLMGKNGHFLVISTGRSKSEVYPWLLDMPWDGLICAAGAYVEWHGQNIYSKYMNNSILKIITDYIEKNSGTYILEGSQAIWEKASLVEANKKNMSAWIKASNGDGSIMLIPKASVFTDLSQVSYIHKLNFHGMNTEPDFMENELNTLLTAAGLPSVHVIRFNMGNAFNTSGEITLNGIHKSYGVDLLLKASGISRDASIAFGDSLNDYEMIAEAGTGVAMGNACDAIKNVADLVTDHINNDGIYNAAKKLGLI